MKHYLAPILTIVLLAFELVGLSACSVDIAKAYRTGYETGFAIGVEEGKKAAKADTNTTEAANMESGYKTGYKEGYEAGSKERQSTPVAPSTPTVATTLYTNPVWGYSIQVVRDWKVDDTN